MIYLHCTSNVHCTSLVKMVYLHCTSNVHCTSPNLSLKVVFLFKSFLVITVLYFFIFTSCTRPVQYTLLGLIVTSPCTTCTTCTTSTASFVITCSIPILPFTSVLAKTFTIKYFCHSQNLHYTILLTSQNLHYTILLS